MKIIGEFDKFTKDVFKEGSFIYFMFWALVILFGAYCLFYAYTLISKGSCTTRRK
jgi:hypothetical protein